MAKKIMTLDYAMKNVLRNKAHFGVLGGLLSELLGRHVAIQEILESESNVETPFNKLNRLDLKAKIDGGEIAIFEVQVERQSDFFHRILFGSSRAVVEQLYKGDHYGKIKKVYSVSVVYFDLGAGSDYVYRGVTEFKGVHNEDTLLLSEKEQRFLPVQTFSGLQSAGIIFPEYYIVYPNWFDGQTKNTLDEWVYALKTSKVESTFSATGIQEAGEALAVEKMDEWERVAYENHLKALRVKESETESSIYEGILIGRKEGKEIGIVEGKEIGKAEGIEIGKVEGKAEGKAEGRHEEKLENAKAMKAKGIDVSTIAEITGLSADDIRRL